MKNDLNKLIEFSHIEEITTKKKYTEGEIIFFEGEIPHYFYLLLSGFVKVYKTDHKCNEIVLHNFAPTTFIAEMASIENFKFPASAVALSDCVIALIKKNEFIDILKTHPEISFLLTKSLTRKIKALEGLLNRSLIFDATTTIASYIYHNEELFKTKKNKIIANELNITPETLSRVLKKLKDLKILDNESNIIDKNKLEVLLNF
ncbi:MAG: Crp/Fnr family transcriptional regulator [Epsilonproteobacteria bacterium]|nr:Crp/Fnr family transcriptional regulator [Campylobacterota bacterium]